MSFETSSTLQLVESENFSLTRHSTEKPQTSEISNDEVREKTIFNDAFEETNAGNKDENDLNLTPSSSLDDLERDGNSDILESEDGVSETEIQQVVVTNDESENRSELETSQCEVQSSSSSKSIIIDEKDSVEIYFKSDDDNVEDLEPVAELNISSAVTVQPGSSLSIKTQTDTNVGREAIDFRDTDVNQTSENRKVDRTESAYLHHDTDLDFYPLSSDEHRNCCYRCWYSETCNACIIGLIDRIPDKCLCPCLLSCYRCLQVVLCCDWS